MVKIIDEDVEIALRWVSHIDNPCTVRVEDETRDIRYFYLKEAEKLIHRLTSPLARNILENAIWRYER